MHEFIKTTHDMSGDFYDKEKKATNDCFYTKGFRDGRRRCNDNFRFIKARFTK